MKKEQDLQKKPIYAEYGSLITLENLEDIRKICKSYLITTFINIFFAIITFSLIITGFTFLNNNTDKASSLLLIGYFLLIPFIILFLVNLILNFILISKANFYRLIDNNFSNIFILFIIGIFIWIPTIIGCFLVFKRIKEVGVNQIK